MNTTQNTTSKPKQRKTRTRKPKATMYIIHAEGCDKEPHHYIGITNRKNLRTRAKEHRSSHGNKALRELAAQGATLQIFPILHNATTEDEKDAHLTKDKRGYCPLCKHLATTNTNETWL